MALSTDSIHTIVFEHSPDAIIVTDSDRVIRSVNPAFTMLFGYRQEEAAGMPVAAIYVDAGDYERIGREHAQQDLEMPVRHYTIRYRRKDGSIFAAEATARTVLEADGRRSGSVAIIRDVSQRVKLTELFQRLYRETPAMMHSVDPGGRLVEVSDYWLMKMGYDSRDEVIGRPVVEFHPPEQRQRAQQCIEEFWQTGAPVRDRPYDFLRKDGATFEVELSVIVARPKGEAEARSLAVSFDVTDRNRAWRELEKKNDELQRLNDELETFASVASHDLQEPLRKIRRFADILEEELPERLSGDGAYALGAMRSAVQRMQRLIADLLDYAHAANAVIAPQPVDLRDVVERVNDDLSVAISEADARVSAGTLPTIHGDAQQLRQLFQNLVGNALKYRDHARPCEIDIAAEPGGADCAWRVSVRDNGIGFDPRAAEAIFLPFRRLQARTGSSGSGLGLTICGRIAERHGWSLKAKSAPGEGSTFTLEIPAAVSDQFLNAPGGGATGSGATQSMV